MSEHERPEPPEQRPDAPEVGVDEWVARVGRAHRRRGGRLAALSRRPSASRGGRTVAAAVACIALVPFLSSSDYVDPRRRRHSPLHPARARPQRRRSAGPGCSTWASSLSTASAPMPTRCSRRTSSACTGPAQSVTLVIIASALLGLLVGLPSRRLIGRLPGDRDPLLRADLRRDDDRTRTAEHPFRGRRRPTSPAGRTGSPTSTRSRIFG